MTKKILMIVDWQYDFVNKEGTMYVPSTKDLFPKLIDILPEFDGLVFTMDAHPVNHCSFQENGGQWARHCVEYSRGASIPYAVLINTGDIPTLFLKKGTNKKFDEYSAFANFKNIRKFERFVNKLTFSLSKKENVEIYVCGVAGDYCVKETVEQLNGGYRKWFMHTNKISEIKLIKDLCPCIDTSFDVEAFCAENGVTCVESSDLTEPYIAFVKNQHIGTGCKLLDERLSGGLMTGSVGVISSETGIGKTNVSISFGANAVDKGYKVLHITTEDKPINVLKKYVATISGVSVNEFDKFKDELQFLHAIGNFDDVQVVQCFGNTPESLKLVFKEAVANGFVPDVVIVDGADRLLPTITETSKFYDEMSLLARENNVAVWITQQTPHQTVRFPHGYPIEVLLDLKHVQYGDNQRALLFQPIIQRGNVDETPFVENFDNSACRFQS